MGAMTELFITSMKRLNDVVVQDIKEGRPWTYSNIKTPEKSFELNRKAGQRYLNCVTGIFYALQDASDRIFPEEIAQWYGGAGEIVWLTDTAETEVKKYFRIIDAKGKTVKKAIADGTLKPGDICTYKTKIHTNVYLGDGMSFDSGHAFCEEDGEDVPFTKWIGETPYQNYKLNYILRLKDNIISKKRQFAGVVNCKKQLKVRTGPGYKFDLLPECPVLDDGEVVEVCDFITNTAGNLWYYIRVSNRVYGYVFANNIDYPI